MGDWDKILMNWLWMMMNANLMNNVIENMIKIYY